MKTDEPCSDFSAPTSSSPSAITVEHCAQAFAGIADVVKNLRTTGSNALVGNYGVSGAILISWADQLTVLIGPAVAILEKSNTNGDRPPSGD